MSDQIDSIDGMSDGEVRQALENGRLTAYAAERRQLTSTEGMSADQIAKAARDGRLDEYLATSRKTRT